jgi:ribonucleoside-diphosphate reductase alpha chain
MVTQLQVVLLSLGVLSYIDIESDHGPVVYKLIIDDPYLDAFQQVINFEATTYQELDHDIVYDEVVEILDHKDDFYDIEVVDDHEYVANGMLSHNTISFLMDAATFGIEPEYSLIRYKNLVGGGQLKITNNVMEEALKNLGYTKDVYDHFIETEELDISPKHKKIFECANDISIDGHLLMMSAWQKYVSGALSKTLNMPNNTTPEEIIESYIKAHELGLKGLIVYRDGSKYGQVLTSEKETKKKELKIGERQPLPSDRPGGTHKFVINGQVKGYINYSTYEDGSLGEFFIRIAKEGSTLSGLLDSLATQTSISLQYGVPLESIVDKMINRRFEPSGFTQNEEIRMTHSIVDYIFKFLGLRFLDDEALVRLGLKKGSDNTDSTNSSVAMEASFCPECGSQLRKLGSCEFCNNCGYNGGACS